MGRRPRKSPAPRRAIVGRLTAHARLRLLDLTMIVVSLVIGMGIFRTPVNAAQGAGEAWIFFAAWIAGGLIALCGALTYAEIGSRYPVTGGFYRVFARVYHPSIAFAITSIILVSNAASAAGVALIGAEYLGKVLFPGAADPHALRLAVAAATLVLFFALNLLGLRASARAQNVLSAIKIALILGLVAALFVAEPAAAVAPTPAPAPLAPADAVKAFGLALIATCFTYGGYQQAINFGGEVVAPARTVPRGVFLGIGVVIALYLAINLTYVRVIGFEALKSAESIAALLAGALLGPAGYTALSLLLFLSVLGYVNVALLTNPRLLRAMSDDDLLPRRLGRLHPTTGAPVAGLALFTLACLGALFYAQTFDQILSDTMFLESIGMATSAAALFALRRRPPDHEDPGAVYQMRLYPLLPLVFIAAYLFIAASVALADPGSAARGLAFFAAFLALYALRRRVRPASATPGAEPP